MKFFIIFLAITCIFNCALVKKQKEKFLYWDESSTLSKSKKTGTKPTERELCNLLLANIETSIDEIDYPETCDMVNTHTFKKIKKFSEFLGNLLYVQTETPYLNGIEIKIDGPFDSNDKNKLIWHVIFNFTKSDNEIEMYPQWAPDGTKLVFHTLTGKIKIAQLEVE